MELTSRTFCIRCPRCRQPMTSYTAVIFLSNFSVVIEGVCCGAEITSGELNILELMPEEPDPKKCH